MARNKHPEETVKRILEVSFRLFRVKGYEHTTIQDIVDALGMSKGAIYHHFKSKEDIYDHITDLYYDRQDWLRDPVQFPGKTGRDKISGLLVFLLSDPEKLNLDQISTTVSLNPKLLALALESTIRDAAPCLETLIHLGNADGSLHVEQPKEAAEAFMILMNMWIGAFATTMEDFTEKLRLLQAFSDGLGMPVIDERLLETARRYYNTVMAFQISRISQETAAP